MTTVDVAQMVSAPDCESGEGSSILLIHPIGELVQRIRIDGYEPSDKSSILLFASYADVLELGDKSVLETDAERLAGSMPVIGTVKF